MTKEKLEYTREEIHECNTFNDCDIYYLMKNDEFDKYINVVEREDDVYLSIEIEITSDFEPSYIIKRSKTLSHDMYKMIRLILNCVGYIGIEAFLEDLDNFYFCIDDV